MRVLRNERHIRVFSAIGKYATMAGLLTLLTGLVISIVRPYWFAPLLVSAVLGMSLSAIGGFFADRYVSPLAHHTALVKALKGLDNRYTLLQYVTPVPHLLLEPGGCTVFVVKAQGGEVVYEDGRWKHRQKGKFFRQFAGQEALGAPHLEAERLVHKLKRHLARRLPDAEVPVRAVILFVNPNVTVNADASPVPVFYSKKVKAWLRGPGRLKPLPPEVQRQLAEVFGVTS